MLISAALQAARPLLEGKKSNFKVNPGDFLGEKGKKAKRKFPCSTLALLSPPM